MSRPIIKDIVKDTTLDIEKFQNETIRPIIKMQHNHLIAIFKDYILKKKIDFRNLSVDHKKDKIKSTLHKDGSFKKFIVGTIVGQFSIQEIEYYLENSRELTRRILQIVTQRLQDSLSELD